MERLSGIDLDATRRTSGNGFYYLMGDVAGLRCHPQLRPGFHDRPGLYLHPPYMIRARWSGVMSFTEMENMMHKIEGRTSYLIGTSEHSMIGKFVTASRR